MAHQNDRLALSRATTQGGQQEAGLIGWQAGCWLVQNQYPVLHLVVLQRASNGQHRPRRRPKLRDLRFRCRVDLELLEQLGYPLVERTPPDPSGRRFRVPRIEREVLRDAEVVEHPEILVNESKPQSQCERWR